jgi:TonB family protein
MLCLGSALAAQESAPASKSDPDPQQPPAPQPQVPPHIKVSPGVSEGLIAKKVQPDYPQLARTARIQGDVVLKIIVSSEGEVSQVNLISGHPLLAAAAISAVKQWKYKPYLLNGNPVAVETQVVVAFRLDTSEGAASAKPDVPPAASGVTGNASGGTPDGQRSGVTGGIISSTPATPRVATPQRVLLSSGMSSALVLKRVYPTYPPEARKGHIQGTVVMHAIISNAGDIETIELVSGDPLLSPAAIDAVKQWKYKPYLVDGKPVEVDTQIHVNLTLAGD